MSYLFALILAFSALASDIPEATISRLKKIYPDQSEKFLRERIAVALTAQDKWTAFPPYFYELIKRSAQLTNRTGLCAGDAHFENFGFLYGRTPHFGLNDLDDVSICSLDADAMRLFIGHRLQTSVVTSEWMKAYASGLKGEFLPMPAALRDLEWTSLKGGRSLSKKVSKLLDKKKCDGDYKDLTDHDKKMLTSWLHLQGMEWVHGCSRYKIKGGSAGHMRYVVFQKNSAFELKPLNTPAPDFDKTYTHVERKDLYLKSVVHFLGMDFSHDYFPVTLNGVLYQRRPLIAGNVPVKIDQLATREMAETLLYEAYTLGITHAKSTKSMFSHSAVEWESLALKLEKIWRSEFAE